MGSRLQSLFFTAALGCGLCAGAPQFQETEGSPVVTIVPRVSPATVETHPLLRVDSALVQVPVHVTNSAGATVNNLKRDDFRLFEDREEQTIASFTAEEAPVSIGLLFDASGSMRPKIRKATEAAAAFFQTSNRDDEFFLVEFNDKARLVVPFTMSPDEIYEQILHTRPGGRTTLIDAMYLSLAQMKHARHARKAIVILSDGGDNWSRHSARELRTALIESDVQVYAMGIFDEDVHTTEEKNGPQLLDKLTAETGGRHYRVDDLESLPEISRRIGRELRSQYLLGYYSTNPARDGKYRQIGVKVATPENRDLHISYRRGYYAPLD